MNVASSEARFGEPEIAFFSAPPTLLMPWVVGMKKCKELLLTGKVIDAWEAERIGIVNKVVAPEALEEEALQMARDLAKVPAASLRFNKLAINQTYELQGLLQALRYNLETSILTYMSESPEDRAATSQFGSYSVKVEQQRGEVIVRSKLLVKVSRVEPADYAAWKRFCEEADSALSPRLLVKP